MADESTQLSLTLPRKPLGVDIAVVRRLPTLSKAISLSAELAGLVNDKDQARVLDLDATTWSLIKDGKRAFPQDRYETMFDQFGNEVPLIWLADRRGYSLTPLESELERRLRLERERAEKAEATVELLRGLIAR